MIALSILRLGESLSEHRIPKGTLAVLGSMVLVWLLPVESYIDYARTGGPGWSVARALSAHLCHWSSSHLAWNALGVAVLGAACESRDRRAFWWICASSALSIGLAIQLAMPGLDSYRGMSGIVSAWFGWLCLSLIREQWQSGARAAAWISAAAALGFITRCGFTWLSGDVLFMTNPSGALTPVPGAHAVGLATGLAFALGSRSNVTTRTPHDRRIATLRTHVEDMDMHREPAHTPAVFSARSDGSDRSCG